MERLYRYVIISAVCLILCGLYTPVLAAQYWDTGYAEFAHEQKTGWDAVPYIDYSPEEQARRVAYELLLDELWEKNETFFYIYRVFNPFFLNHIMSNIFTIICAFVSFVAFFMLGHTAEERKVLFVFLLLGIFCWLRLIVMAIGLMITGRPVL